MIAAGTHRSHRLAQALEGAGVRLITGLGTTDGGHLEMMEGWLETRRGTGAAEGAGES